MFSSLVVAVRGTGWESPIVIPTRSIKPPWLTLHSERVDVSLPSTALVSRLHLSVSVTSLLEAATDPKLEIDTPLFSSWCKVAFFRDCDSMWLLLFLSTATTASSFHLRRRNQSSKPQ
ncbi:hypothetical protein F2Q69_00056132 [Brassica cretica]|uniref:Uncharacterized protein n=1 Tax=Brassica cretica TaxID=69181 RepID=A0A8S9N6M7_BRACR|nr:hypothetical protein F2Q69_00056132 [Brassica cretica]